MCGESPGYHVRCSGDYGYNYHQWTEGRGRAEQPLQAGVVQATLSELKAQCHTTCLSEAVDIAPYPINWKDTEKFYYVAGIVMGVAGMLGIELRWGGDWDRDDDLHDQTFMDLGHFELVR